MPDAIANEPYSTIIDISGGAIKSEYDLYIKATPAISNISFQPTENNFYNSIFLNAIFEHDGQYTINLSGFGYSPKPLRLDHNYVLNVLSQSSVCSYQNTAYDLSKYKHYKQSTSMFQLLSKAIMGKEYMHQIRLFSSNTKNFHLSKQDMKLTIFPENSGLKVRPINESSYDTVELYGTPKAIGSIALVIHLYKIPDEIIRPLRYFIVHIFPDQSNCPIK